MIISFMPEIIICNSHGLGSIVPKKKINEPHKYFTIHWSLEITWPTSLPCTDRPPLSLRMHHNEPSTASPFLLLTLVTEQSLFEQLMFTSFIFPRVLLEAGWSLSSEKLFLGSFCSDLASLISKISQSQRGERTNPPGICGLHNVISYSESKLNLEH